MLNRTLALVVGMVMYVSAAAACCCCDELNIGGAPTLTPTATATATAALPPETPGNIVDCVSTSTTVTSQSGGGSSWDFTHSREAYDAVFLNYDSTSGTTAILKLSSLDFTFPTVGTIIHGIEVFDPGAALPNGLTAPFLPTDHPCDSWDAVPRNTYAQLSNEAGAPVGDDKSTNHNITTSPQQLFGDAESDLWGNAWTPAKLNDPDFGIFLTYDYTTAPVENKNDCDIYHIVVSDDPANFPNINSQAAQFRICYEHPDGTPVNTHTATPTATITSTPTVTDTPTPSINETRYNPGAYSQTANGGTLTWTGPNPTTIWNSVTTSTNLLRIPLTISSTPPYNTAPGAGATILGITVSGNWLTNTVNSTTETTFKLLDSTNTLVGNNKGTGTTVVTGATTRGTSSDAWGTGWTGTDIAGAWGFGIQVAGSDSGPPGALTWQSGTVSVFWTP